MQTLSDVCVRMYIHIMHTHTYEHTQSQDTRKMVYVKLLGSENFSTRKDHRFTHDKIEAL